MAFCEYRMGNDPRGPVQKIEKAIIVPIKRLIVVSYEIEPYQRTCELLVDAEGGPGTNMLCNDPKLSGEACRVAHSYQSRKGEKA